MKAVICLSGSIAAGKTTVAKELAEHISNSAVRSFGDVVRHHARSQGMPLDRATLQEVGLSLVEAGWQSFVDALLEDIPRPVNVLIVEGVRHREAVEEIRNRNQSDMFFVIYLKIESHVQERRLQERGELPEGRAHTVESSLAEVEDIADMVIDGDLPLNQIAGRILSGLSTDLSTD